MGCDIHFVVERRLCHYDAEQCEYVPTEPAKWVGVYGTWWTPALMGEENFIPKPGEPLNHLGWLRRVPGMKGRNYEFFAALAGVRGDGPEPKGFPDDASELAREMTDVDGDDHSHSWDTLEDFLHKWLLAGEDEKTSAYIQQLLAGKQLLSHVAGVWDQSELAIYRVVYWFDN